MNIYIIFSIIVSWMFVMAIAFGAYYHKKYYVYKEYPYQMRELELSIDSLLKHLKSSHSINESFDKIICYLNAEHCDSREVLVVHEFEPPDPFQRLTPPINDSYEVTMKQILFKAIKVRNQHRSIIGWERNEMIFIKKNDFNYLFSHR